MKRALVGLCVAVFCFISMSRLAEADKKKNEKPKPPVAETATPHGDKIAGTLGSLKWGMNKDEVIKVLTEQIKARYRPIVAGIKDGVESDRITSRMSNEINQLGKNYEQFDGKRTGWSNGFLRNEFTQNNGESMMTVKDQNSQNYYFFINDRLWKWYKVYNDDVFAGKTFEQFGDAEQLLWGKGKDTNGELAPGSGNRHWLEWEDKDTRLRAVDQMGFFGFYCAIFEGKEILRQLPSLRKNAPEVQQASANDLVDAVTSDSAANPDANPDIVDRITGRIRTQEKPKQEAADSSQSKPQSSGDSKSASVGSSPAKSKTARNKPHKSPEF